MATTPTTTTTTPPSTPVIPSYPVNFDQLGESWCDIQYKSGCSSTGSITHLNHTVNPEILEKLLQEAQREVLSPPLASQATPFQFRPIQAPAAMSVSHSLSLSQFTFPDEFSDAAVIPTVTPSSWTNARANTNCTSCVTQQLYIDLLLEKQASQERQIILMRKAFSDEEVKTPELSVSSNCSSSTSTPPMMHPMHSRDRATTAAQLALAIRRQNSGVIDLSGASSPIVEAQNSEKTSQMTTTDWSKFWSSRPQTQPPKEWNFIHPNSTQSKLSRSTMSSSLDQKQNVDAALDKMSAKVSTITSHSIGKLIFTHVASLIVGATLMFLVFRRHLNNAGTPAVIYF